VTTSQFTVAGSNAGDAAFRAWGKGLSDALVAVGMVRTADTGQINWTTATAPANNYSGYEIFRFNDALQTTHPLFLKIEYGAPASGAPQIRTQFGKGSNGAGALTGAFGAALVQTTSNVLGTAPCYVSSGDGSELLIAMWPSIASWPFFLYVERSRDAAGVPTGTAFSLVFNSGGASPQCRFYNYASAAVHTVSRFRDCCGMPANGPAGLAQGGRAPVFLALFTDALGTYWQPRGIAYYITTDAGSWAPVTVEGYGTYMPLGPNSTGSTGTAIAMQWV
jgi:hypothetical protein